MKKLFCCPALELFCCLPLWKTVLFVSSRAFSLSTPTLLLSTPVENSEATWKKATKCNENIHNTCQGPPNPGFMQEKVQKWDFLKKPSRELFFCFCFRFLWIPQRPGMLNEKRLVFLPSKNLYRQCVLGDDGGHSARVRQFLIALILEMIFFFSLLQSSKVGQGTIKDM